jgi:hypothetical protein
MPFSVPLLLEKSYAVVHRLDVASTDTFEPYGLLTSGYDDDFKEPIIFNDSGTRTSATQELASVNIPCQVETITTEELDQSGPGNTPSSFIQLVFHRTDLKALGLVDNSQNILLKVNDRVSAIKSYAFPDVTTHDFKGDGLYIVELNPRSFGFGTYGFDLWIAKLNPRKLA